MKKLLSSLLAALCISGPVLAADPEIKEWNTYHSLGCMLLRECRDGVQEIYSSSDVDEFFQSARAKEIQAEFDELTLLLSMAGVGVFVGDAKYFPRGHRGVYHVTSNNFYLNREHMGRPGTLITLVRHEGWHAVQDCMGGTISNSILAIVHNEEDVPGIWQTIGVSTYEKGPLPWEKEALWAGHTKGKTIKGLEACLRGNMWEAYPPTPLTRKYLVENGYIKD